MERPSGMSASAPKKPKASRPRTATADGPPVLPLKVPSGRSAFNAGAARTTPATPTATASQGTTGTLAASSTSATPSVRRTAAHSRPGSESLPSATSSAPEPMADGPTAAERAADWSALPAAMTYWSATAERAAAASMVSRVVAAAACPSTDTPRSGSLLSDGNSIHAPIATAGTMPTNTTRHDTCSAIWPAIAGPINAGMIHALDSSASSRGRKASGYPRATATNATAPRHPAPNPCTARAINSTGQPGARLAITRPIENATKPSRAGRLTW